MNENEDVLLERSEGKVYHQVKKRELKRFHQAVETAVQTLLSQKHGQLKEEEYTRYMKTCALIEENLRVIDRIADRLAPLFEQTEARTRWEIYLGGVRQVLQAMPDSYLFQFVLPMFKLEDLKEKVLSYSEKCLEESHLTQKALTGVERYLKSLTEGQEISAKYQSENKALSRLYASIEAWETKEDFDRFLADFKSFLETSLEVFVSGPIQLYLMISREGFLLIFKALSIGKLSELEEEKKVREIMALHDWVHRLVVDSQTLKVLQEILKASVVEYFRLFREEHIDLRRQLPTKELKRRFKERFERGVLFREEEE